MGKAKYSAVTQGELALLPERMVSQSKSHEALGVWPRLSKAYLIVAPEVRLRNPTQGKDASLRSLPTGTPNAAASGAP